MDWRCSVRRYWQYNQRVNLNRLYVSFALVTSLGLAGCQVRANSPIGPPPEGGSLGAKSTVGAGGTNAPTLGSSTKISTGAYDGAGYQTPSFPATTIPNSIGGLPAGPTTLQLEYTQYGPVLASPQGKTLYMRLGDTPTHAGCISLCTRAFPPELTNGAPQAKGGILAAYLGVLTSAIVGEQVAYAGHPLYTYSGDTKPGEIGAQDAGGIWFAVTPEGGPLRTPAVSPTTTSAG